MRELEKLTDDLVSTPTPLLVAYGLTAMAWIIIIYAILCSLVGASKAKHGERYRFPLAIRFL